MSSLTTQYVSIQIPEHLYLELAKSYSPNVSSNIVKILSEHIPTQSYSTDSMPTSEASFTWSPLTLPSGTKLRVRYKNQEFIADIINGKLFWNDKAYPSVSELINTMRNGTRNNAWRCTEIRYPNDTNWVLADRLRASDEAKRFFADLL